MKLFSFATTLLLLTNVVTASVGTQAGKDSLDMIRFYRLIAIETAMLLKGNHIVNRLNYVLTDVNSSVQGDTAIAIRTAQETAIKSQIQANEDISKVIDALNKDI
ncbi:hypothetical protein GGI16_006235 [Coemansia sp. S142-1]|nr:hypothetical protein GGI16_006235 [Coemansia sp. S142-1]